MSVEENAYAPTDNSYATQLCGDFSAGSVTSAAAGSHLAHRPAVSASIGRVFRSPARQEGSAMYTQGLNVKDPGKPAIAEDPAKLARFQAKVDAEDKIEPNDWMPESLPAHAGPADLPACAFRDHRHAAGGQLDHARAVAAAQGGAARQGAGRGGPRPLPLRRRRDARHLARGDGRPAARRARPSIPRSSTTRRCPGPTSAPSAGWSTARRS